MKKKLLTFMMVFLVCLTFTGCSLLRNEATGKSTGIDSGQESRLPNDIVRQTAWKTSEDGSYLIFQENDWGWYQNEAVRDDNYYKGTYDFYIGEPAARFLTTDLKDYGVTREELEKTFARNKNYKMDNLVCMTLLHKSFMVNGKEQLQEEKALHYFGFLLDDGKCLDIVNMTTGTSYKFLKQKSSEL